MNVRSSISNIFARVKEELTPKLLTLDDVIRDAEDIAEDVRHKMEYIENMSQDKGSFASLFWGFPVERAQWDLEFILGSAMSIAKDLDQRTMKDAEAHRRLKEVERTFGEGAKTVVEFIKSHASYKDIPDPSVEMWVLSAVIDRFEAQPKASVTSIRSDIHIDG